MFDEVNTVDIDVCCIVFLLLIYLLVLAGFNCRNRCWREVRICKCYRRLLPQKLQRELAYALWRHHCAGVHK